MQGSTQAKRQSEQATGGRWSAVAANLRGMKRRLAVLVFFIWTASAYGQFAKGYYYGEVMASGATSLPGGVKEVRAGNLSLYIGKILTEEHGKAFLRGNLEYGVNLVPLCILSQQGMAYGGGVDPVVLRWNFSAPSRVSPYVEVAGGTLFTSRDIPKGASNINFTRQAAAGVYVRPSGRWFNIVADMKYENIGNAGLASRDPGINLLQFGVGIRFGFD